MATAALSHRRKGTTYGTSYSKPCFNLSFGSDGLPPMQWDPSLGTLPKKVSSNKEKPPTEPSLKTQVRLPFAAAVRKGKPSYEDEQIDYWPAQAESSSDNATLCDYASLDEEKRKRRLAPSVFKERRRKLSPNGAPDQLFPVFDDESLQKHILAQALAESNGKVGQPHNVQYNRRNCAESKPLRQAAKDRPRPLPANRMPKVNTDAGETRVRRYSVKRPPDKPYKTAEVGYRPTTVSKAPDRALSGAAELRTDSRTRNNQAKCFQPKAHGTPPRSTILANTTTTPRQRELWGLLLIDENRKPRSSYVDLPSMPVNEYEAVTACQKPSISVRRKHPEAGGKSDSRGKRIIDTLAPSDRDQMPAKDNFDGCPSDPVRRRSSCNLSYSGQSEDSVMNDIWTFPTSSIATAQLKDSRVTYQAQSVHQPTAAFQSGQLRVTYAHQRSYLNDNGHNEVDTFDLRDLSESKTTKQTWRYGLLPKPHINSTDNLCHDEEGFHGNTMRSIHELREAGGNARLVGVLETSLDELDESQLLSSSSRLPALINLASKLQEASNCRLLVEKGLEARFLTHINNSHDLITDSLFAAAILRLIVHSPSATLMSQIENFQVQSFLIKTLDSNEDLNCSARSGNFNLSRFAQRDYTALCTSFLESSIWRAGNPSYLSCQLLSLQCLEHIARGTREGRFTTDSLSAAQIEHLVETSIPYSKALSQGDQTTLILLELAVSTLESCTIGSAHGLQVSLSETALERIIGILPGLGANAQKDWEPLQVLTLRLYINVTNTMPWLCETFAKPEVIDPICAFVLSLFAPTPNGNLKHQQSVLDRAILSLGCLINFAESSDNMRHLSLRNTRGDPSLVDTLLDIFLTKSREVAEVCLASARCGAS